MRSVRFVCLFAILISMLVLAQSSRAPLGNQSNGMPVAQQPRLALPPSLSQMPQGASYAQRAAGAFKPPAPRRGALPLSGGLSFANAVAYDSGGYEASSVAVADVNGDGKPDLVVANWCVSSDSCYPNGSVGVLLGNGDGTFQTAVAYGSGGYQASSVAVADVNGDGRPDLLVANEGESGGSVGVLIGNGDGTFQTAVPYGSGGSDANSVAVADVNGDGKPDVLVANFASNTVGVLLGNGDGTFQAAVPYGSGGYDAASVAVADVNGDGKPDLVVANGCASSDDCNDQEGPGSVSVLLGNGDGTFQTAVAYGSGGYQASSVAVADVNGDGKPDLIVTNCSGSGACGGVDGTVGVFRQSPQHRCP